MRRRHPIAYFYLLNNQHLSGRLLRIFGVKLRTDISAKKKQTHASKLDTRMKHNVWLFRNITVRCSPLSASTPSIRRAVDLLHLEPANYCSSAYRTKRSGYRFYYCHSSLEEMIVVTQN